MRIVLHQGVRGLGNRGDVVDVADGYARNYLIPQGFAQRANAGVEAQAEVMRKAWGQKNTQLREAAEEVAKTLVAKTIVITARASGEGKLFGSVNLADITQAIEAQTGVVLDRKSIHLDEGIRSVGTHSVKVQPHADVEFPVTLEVSAL
ncbi:MAG: 50S ribosomal protein L9 [Actinomycetota bacterium]|nr:50S ribosomal protein L9 [Actinomycetota bacterium]